MRFLNGRDRQIVIPRQEFQSEGFVPETDSYPPEYVRVTYLQSYIDQARELLEKGQPGAQEISYSCDMSYPTDRRGRMFGSGRLVISATNDQIRFEMDDEVCEVCYWAHFCEEDAEVGDE